MRGQRPLSISMHEMRRDAPQKHRKRHTQAPLAFCFFSFFGFYYENKTNAPGEGSMITRNIKEYFLPFLFCCVEASIAINKLKLLTLDSFSVTDIYRNILETALKSLRKVTVNLHAHHTEK